MDKFCELPTMFEGFDFELFFKNLKDQRILIIGDVMIDTYLWGQVNRVSPEAPVPIVSDIVEENRLGGAANVALNIKAMGAVPILCSVIGGDEKGSLLLDLMEEQNLSDVGITVDDFRITTQKTRVISGFKHLLRFDEEIQNILSKRVQDEFVEMILGLIKSGSIDAVIFQDYDKGVVTPGIISKVTKLMNKYKLPVMVDPKFRNFKRFKNVTMFKPNLKELIAGLEVAEKKNLELIEAVGETFRKEMKQEILLLTLSDKGILVLSDGEAVHIPARKREVVDVSGAGDTVISVSALCYRGGMSPEQIAVVANIAGGQVCEKSGVVPVNKAQLLAECKEVLR